MWYPKGDSMIIANQHYREYSTTTVCLRWKIPLTKNILVIMKSGNSIVVQLSRHKFNLFIMNRYM